MISKYLGACIVLVLLSTSAFGQAINVKKLSNLDVAEDLRARLAERLNLFIEYEISRQYERQYDLLATHCPDNLPCGNVSREEYIKDKLRIHDDLGTLLELKFNGLVERKLRGDCTFLKLKPKLRKGDAVFTYPVSAIACLQNRDWYFGFWYVDI